jgi:hypothetical protein
MNSTELITPAPDTRSFRELLSELDPLIGAIAGYGPPVIALGGPWLLLGLMLAGPFAFLMTLVVVMVLAVALIVALAAAIVAAPYLLVRHARHALDNARAPRLVPVESRQVAA